MRNYSFGLFFGGWGGRGKDKGIGLYFFVSSILLVLKRSLLKGNACFSNESESWLIRKQ